MSHPPRQRGGLRAFGLLVLAASLAAAGSAPAADDVGRVVAVRGSVTAAAPGEAPRQLHCDDPIYEGDRIVSGEGAGLGIMSDGVYSGLDEKTTLAFRTTEQGAPELDLEVGHLRVLDAANDESPRIQTPGLLAYNAGNDTEAIVSPEKLGTLSMVCPYDESVSVTRVAMPGVGVRPEPGQCAIEKPKEPLFLADASHPRLGVINDHCSPVAGLVGPRFLPDVAAGPGLDGPPIGPPINSPYNVQAIRDSCDNAASCLRGGLGGGGRPGLRKGGFVCIPPPGGAC